MGFASLNSSYVLNLIRSLSLKEKLAVPEPNKKAQEAIIKRANAKSLCSDVLNDFYIRHNEIFDFFFFGVKFCDPR